MEVVLTLIAVVAIVTFGIIWMIAQFTIFDLDKKLNKISKQLDEIEKAEKWRRSDG